MRGICGLTFFYWIRHKDIDTGVRGFVIFTSCINKNVSTKSPDSSFAIYVTSHFYRGLWRIGRVFMIDSIRTRQSTRV